MTDKTPPATPGGNSDAAAETPDWFTSRLGDLVIDSDSDANYTRHITLRDAFGTFILADVAKEAWTLSRARQSREAYRLLAAPFPRGAVTDTEVEAGAIALHAEECGDETCDHILNEFEPSSRAVLEAAREAQIEQISDPNTIPNEVADAAQIEHYEFAFGSDVQPLTPRQLGISRQAWKRAIAVAIDKMNERP